MFPARLTSVVHLLSANLAQAHATCTPPPGRGTSSPGSEARAQASTGASAGRLSMKELTEKTALPAPGGP